MAVTITTDLVTLYDANTAFGGGTTYAGFQRFGTNCNGVQVSNTTNHYTGTVTSFSLVGRTIYSWMVGPASIGTLSQGGYRIVIGDGTNTRAYYVGGRDVKSFLAEGWFCFILNGDNLPTQFQQLAGSAQPNLSAITLVGVGFTTTSKAVGNSPNCFYDIARVGTGLTIAGGTVGDPGTFLDIIVAESSLSNAWGIVEDLGGGLYGSQGRLTFGSTSANTVFIESGTSLVFQDRIVSEDFYQLNVIGGTSNTNIFTLGEKLGTGEDAIGINGVTIGGSTRTVNVDLSTANSEINIYGSSFNNLGNGTIELPERTASEVISTTFNRSGQVIANTCFLRNNFFINTLSNVASFVWNTDDVNIKNSSFVGNTVSPAVRHTTSTGSPFVYDNLVFNGNTTDIANVSGNPIVVNAVNGSNPVTFTGDVTINNPTTFTVANLVEDTEVRLFRTADRTEVAGVESSTTIFQYQYNYTGDINIYLVVHKPGFEYIKIPNLILGSDDQTITVQQRVDRNFIT